MRVLPLLPIFRQMRDGFLKNIYLCWSKSKIHTTKYIRSCRWTHTQSRKLKMYGDNGQLRLRSGAGVAHNVHRYPTPECY